MKMGPISGRYSTTITPDSTDVQVFQLSRLAKLLQKQPTTELERRLLGHAIYAVVRACQQVDAGDRASTLLEKAGISGSHKTAGRTN